MGRAVIAVPITEMPSLLILEVRTLPALGSLLHTVLETALSSIALSAQPVITGSYNGHLL